MYLNKRSEISLRRLLLEWISLREKLKGDQRRIFGTRHRLKTAKALGIELPLSLLMRIDKVIEVVLLVGLLTEVLLK